MNYTSSALVLTKRLLSTGSDGKRMFVLLYIYLTNKSQTENFT